MQSFTDIIHKWGREELTNDLALRIGIRAKLSNGRETKEFRRFKDRVRKWEELDILPDEHWKAILEMAPKRGIDLSPDLLIDLAARD